MRFWKKSISSVWKIALKTFLVYDYFYVIVHTHEWEVKKETICNVHKLHQFNVLNIYTHTLLFCNNCACINWTIQLLCICGNNFVFLSDSISQTLHFFVLQIHFPINLKFVLQLFSSIICNVFFSLLHTKQIINVVVYWIFREEACRWRIAIRQFFLKFRQSTQAVKKFQCQYILSY